VVAALVAAGAPALGATSGSAEPTKTVIVRLDPSSTADHGAVAAVGGGKVVTELEAINGFTTVVTDAGMNAISSLSGVLEVTEDAQLQIAAPADAAPMASPRTGGFVDTDFAREERGPTFSSLTMARVGKIVGADRARDRAGFDGSGVDVALIDTGVAPVPGIGTIVNGPDLSFDSQVPGMQYLDGFGHGTHLAGIINGSGDRFSGIAPGARVVNVKVGASNGATDVSQVIAAIDWTVQHRRDNGLNIRVINLAFGTDGVQPYQLDPLAYAVEVAWRRGIVVVVAAGNHGETTTTLDNPALDPFVIAVGAAETHGTLTTGDDTVAAFTNRGNASRSVDLIAPGRSVVSLRTPGSFIDVAHPEGVVGTRFLRGSGTSQAAAVVAGSAALLLQAKPELNPDQVKWLLTRTARPLVLADDLADGAGEIDVFRAIRRTTPTAAKAAQSYPTSSGTGSLEAARGSVHVSLDGVVLQGEQDIFGTAWDGLSWSGLSWSGLSWSGGTWNGQSWSGQSWSGQSWSGQSWSGVSWSGLSWSGLSWSGLSWSGQSWSGLSWSGMSWSSAAWSDG
jgi:serine protease AprX